MTTEKKFNKRHNQGVRKNKHQIQMRVCHLKMGATFISWESVHPPEGWK